MRLECPRCDARIRLVDPPEDETTVRCPKCNAKIRLPEPDDEHDDDRPVKTGGRKKRKESEKSFPVVPVVAGSVALIGVVVVAVVLLASGKSETKSTETASAKPEETKGPPTGPPGSGPGTRPGPGGPPGGMGGMPPGGTQPGGTPPGGSRPGGTQPGGTNPGGGTPGGTRPGGTQPGSSNPPPKNPGNPPPSASEPYSDLFRTPIDVPPPPTVRGATLKPTTADIEPEVPTFYSLMTARKEGKNPNPKTPKDAKLTLDEIKKACAYIKVEAGELSATGSGFLISATGTTGLVATNYHVIEAASGPRYGSTAAKVLVVFNSGLPDERELKAEIVAEDPVADLAILRVSSGSAWPKPINPYNALSKVTEGVPIQFWGFPLGEILSSGKKNPEITLGTGTVSSLRYTSTGKLDRVQINGTMNPGNSGGPLVDADGRLVGIAVSIINPKIGTGIGFAVPVNDLIALLEGKLLATLFVPTGIERGQAKFLVFIPVMDPLDRVETVFVRRWAGDSAPPEAVKDPYTGYKPFAMRKDGQANLPGVEEFPLKKVQLNDPDDPTALGFAVGDMSVPADARNVMIQVASQTGANPQTGVRYTAASKPVPYTLSVSDLPVGTDARPFTDLTTNADALAGQVVVVKGRIAAPPVTRDAVQDLSIVGTDGKKPERMRFLVSREDAVQFDEVDRKHQPLPVRVVCLVGKKGADGIIPVRVARLDFIGRGNRIVRTIPAAPAPKDELAAINRDPAKFAGKTVEVQVSGVPITPRIRESNEFMVVFPNHRTPRNVSFTITNSMKQRMVESLGKELRVNMIVPVRLTAVMPEKPALAGQKTVATVTKIEFLDDDGKVISAVE